MKIKQMFKRVVAGVLTAATVLTSISLPAFATYNGTGGGKTYFTVGTIPGINESCWGYRFAIVDPKTGKVQTADGDYLVMDQVQVEEGSTIDTNMDNAYKDNFVRTDINTNLGYVPREYGLFDGQPAPITTSDDGSWVGQGAAFKDWMMKKEGCTLSNGDKTTWGEYISNKFFGKQVRDDLYAGKYKLVVEPIYVMPLYTDYLTYSVNDIYGNSNHHQIKDDDTGKSKYSSYSGIHYFGTFAGSLKALYELPSLMGNSKATGGGGGYQSLAVRASAKAMYLDSDDDDLGLDEAPDLTDDYIAWLRWSDYQGGNTLGKNGYGLHIFSPEPKDLPIHTYDIDNNPKKPAKSEQPDSTNSGKLTIYKVYGEECENPETGKTKIMNIDYFVTEGCAKQVVVMNEKDKTGYQLVAWGCDRTSYNKWIFKEGDKKGDVDYIVAKDWAKVDKETQEVYYNTFKRVLRNEDKPFGQYYLDKDTFKAPKGKNPVVTLTYPEENPLQVEKENKVIYLLYLKKAPWISTYGRPTPPNPMPVGRPYPTPVIGQKEPPEGVYFPENPDNPNNPDKPTMPMTPNPSLLGPLTIVKVYGTRVEKTDSEGNITETATDVATTFMEQTTYNVLIENEDTYNLVDWKLVDQFGDRVTDVKYKASEWLDSNGFDKTKEKTKDSEKVVAEKAEKEEIGEGYKKYLECDKVKGINLDDPKDPDYRPGVLYLLYLKDPGPISTFGRSTPPDTPDDKQDNPPEGVYFPENPDNPNNPEHPDKPEKTMKPDPNLKGDLTIIKVYGTTTPKLDKDGNVITPVTHVRTTHMKDTTYKVLIKNEPTYKIEDWKLVDKDKDFEYTAEEWMDDSGFDKNTVLLGKEEDEKIEDDYAKEVNCCVEGIEPGKENSGVLYVLYLKDPEPISTYGRSTPPDDPDNPQKKPPKGVYFPEDPDNPNNPDNPSEPMDPNPELKGDLTIVKVYGKKVITDNGDGTTTTQAKHIRTTYMPSTTYKVLIEGEPEYTLVDWKLVDKEKDLKYKAPQWLDGFDKKEVLLEKDADEEIGPEYSKEINCNIDGIDIEKGKPGVLYLLYLQDLPKSAFRFVLYIFQVKKIK